MAKNRQNHYVKKEKPQRDKPENRQTDNYERRESLAKRLYGTSFNQLSNQQRTTVTTKISQQDKRYY